MKHYVKSSLILALASCANVALAVEPSSNHLPRTQSNVNKSSDLHQSKMKTVHTENMQALKQHVVHSLKINKNFKEFLVKNMRVTFDDQESELSYIYKDYIGKRMTANLFKELKDKIKAHYIKKDYLIPFIHVSKHALKSGFLKINVIPGTIDDVVLVGEGTKSELMQQYAKHILEQRPATVSNTQRFLALMNQISGYDINYQLQQDGENMVLIVYTVKKKWSAYASLDNYGLNELGKYQASMLAEAYSPFGGSETLLLHGSTTNHPERLSDYGLGYSQAINSYGSSMHMFASKSQDNGYRGDVKPKDNQGNSFKFFLSHHLFIRANKDLEVESGVEYKNSAIYTVENNIAKQHKDSNYWSGNLGLKYLFKDAGGGRNLFKLRYIKGLSGSFYNYSDSQDIADKKYAVTKFDFYREYFLPKNFSLFSHIRADYSKSELPSADKSVFGGREFGRGYKFATLEGNKMIAASLEVRYLYEIQKNFIEHIQPYLFHDMGKVSKQAYNTDVSRLGSMGAGIRFRLEHQVDLGVEAAQPKKKHFTVEGVAQEAKTIYSFFINKVIEF
jgi:hemolysin activation/secretion protein